jgi:hypothetical protein
MLQKIKDFGEAAKNAFIYIVTPIAFVLGFILYLVSKNRSLKDEVETSKAEGKLNELKGKQEEIDHRANNAVSEYEKLRGAYVSGNVRSLRPGSESSPGPGEDPGPGAGPSGDAA